MDPVALRSDYAKRLKIYKVAAESFEGELNMALRPVWNNVDRVSVRVKDPHSFVEKVTKRKKGKYRHPFCEVEDQIAGRVIVRFEEDMKSVQDIIKRRFNAIEEDRREPSEQDKFGYETLHFILALPIECKPGNWGEMDEMPNTVELQVRTIFMHAWAETSHDILYKSSAPISDDDKRMIYWVAASAWGCDQAYNKIINKRRIL